MGIIIGETNYPSMMPSHSSEMLGNNYVALLETLGSAASFGESHWEDPIVKAATVAHKGQLHWPPKQGSPPEMAPPSVITTSTADSTASSKSAVSAQTPVPQEMPKEVAALVQWLKDHRHELASGVGAAAMLGLGFAADIPDAELVHIGYFVLSLLIGHFTVAGVTPALHTPLISVTNAISGIIVIGGMLQLSGEQISARVACALAAVFLSSVNIVGGFAVTHRMLEMFRGERKRAPGAIPASGATGMA